MTARHAMFVGWVAGIANREGVPLSPDVDDDGNYTNRLRLDVDGLELPEGVTLWVVVPPPPDNWVPS